MINELKNKIMKYFAKVGHTFDHTERVYNLAIRIAKQEKADLQVVQAAALLHDIGRKKEDIDPKICHAEESAKLAPKILRSIDFPEKKIEKVQECIKKHRKSKGLKAITKEEKIIQDADRLDCIGATAIVRTFEHGGIRGRPTYDLSIPPMKNYTGKSKTSLNHFYEKILKMKPDSFNTRYARKYAKQRYEFTKKFVEEFEKEIKGIK